MNQTLCYNVKKIVSYVVTKIADKLNLAKAILAGGGLIFIGGIIMILINSFTTPSLIGLVLPMFISSMGIAVIRPSASAGAIKMVDKKIVGSASAMFSFFSFIGAAFFTTLTTKLNYDSILPFGILLAFLGMGATLSAMLTQTVLDKKYEQIQSFG